MPPGGADPNFAGIDPGQLSHLMTSLSGGVSGAEPLASSYLAQFGQLGLDTSCVHGLLSDYAWARSQQPMLALRRDLIATQPSGSFVHGMATAGAGPLTPAGAAQEGTVLAKELAAAEKSGDLAEIKAIGQVIKDSSGQGKAGLALQSAFYDHAAPQVAGLADALYARNGTPGQPLTPADQKILSGFAAGLASVLKNGAGDTALSPQALHALTSAPDMWSVAMLVKYGPPAKAYGTGAGQAFLQAVRGATVQISPHVIVPASDPEVPALRAAWAWALKRPVYLSGSAGDSEFTRWHMIATVSPYRNLFKGQLSTELAGITPDSRIEGTFNAGGKVLISSAGLGSVVFLQDPQSLTGAAPEWVRQLIPKTLKNPKDPNSPPEWDGPSPLKTGAPGWRYNNGKGSSVIYEEGDPNAPNLGAPDSLLHQGPYFKISVNGRVYRIAAKGNPALDDPNAATMSISQKGQPKTYSYDRVATDNPGDGDLEDPETGIEAEGGAGEGAPADG